MFFDNKLQIKFYTEILSKNLHEIKLKYLFEIFSKSNFIFQTVSKNLFGLTKVGVFSS